MIDCVKKRLRVLRFSHTGVVAPYRQRERTLIKEFPVDIELVVPEYWPHIGLGSNTLIEEFPIRSIPTFLTGNIPLFLYDSSRLLQVFAGTAPDVIDIHEEPYSVSCFQIVYLARRYFPQVPCIFYTAQNIKKNYPPPFCFMEKYVYKQSAAAYPCSKGAESVLRMKGYTGQSEVIPLGVDKKLFYPSLQLHDPTTYTIGYFGRIEAYKGLSELFRAAGQLKNDLSVRLIVVGAGKSEADLKAEAAREGIAGDVFFLGEVELERVPELMRSCQVIAIPSRTTKSWKEQFGRVAVEAMACGVTVVSSDSGSLPEVIGAAGILYAEADSNVLAAALRSALLDKQKRFALIEAGKSRVESLYSWERVAEKMYSLYQRVLPS